MSYTTQRLDVYFNEDSIVFEDDCGSQCAINCSCEDNKLTVNINDLMEGLEFLGVDVH